MSDTLFGFDLEVVKNVVTITGTVVALYIGWAGLNTWRRQLDGTSKHELSKNILITTYQIQEAIQYVRNPVMELDAEEVEAGRHLREELRIYSQRLERLNEYYIRLRLQVLEARVWWSDDALSCFEKLYDAIGTIKSEVWIHFWLKGAYASAGATIDKSPGRVAENNKIIYRTFNEDDFSLRLSDAVREIEAVFRSKPN